MTEIREINLLAKTKGASSLGRRIRKVLTYGSFVLALLLIAFTVELFILGKIYDQQIKDLSQDIKSAEGQIQGFKDKEIKYRALVDKLQAVQNISTKQSKAVSLFQSIVNLLPVDISFDSLLIREKDVKITVATKSLFSLELFLQDIGDPKKGGKLLTDIVTSSVSQTIEGNFSANIEAKVK